MDMKKFAFMLLALALVVPCMGQNLKFALVKDEGGVTNIRKGPGTQYEIVDRVQDGMFVNIVPTKKSWTKVYTTYTSDDPQELIGYIATSKLVFPKRQGVYKQLGMVKQEGGYTNIRKGAGTQYEIVGKVKDGSFILWSGDYDSKWKAVYTQQGVFRGYMSGNKIEAMESPMF